MIPLDDILSMSVLLVYIIPGVLYVYTGNVRDLIAIAGVLVTGTLSEGIKHLIIGTRSPRPKGASGCNLLCSDGLQEGKPGMPSGHSATAAFFAGYYMEETTTPWIIGVLLIFAASVMYSRYTKRCHSMEQIVIGGLFGYGMSQLVRVM